jgi:hypothetical protein
MNPWRQHPALQGLPVPDRALPPARTWPRAVELGVVKPMRCNPRDPDVDFVAQTRFQWSDGPVPVPAKGSSPLQVPKDAADTVYLWLTRQASLRLDDVKRHILTGVPTVTTLALQYTLEIKTINGWIEAIRKKAAKKAGTSLRRNPRFRAAVASLEIPQPEPFSPRDMKVPKGALFFASGAQSPGDVEGVARIHDRYRGIGVGIAVNSCKEECRRALDLVRRRLGKIPLFVDSGAYTEFKSKKAISKDEWKRRMGDYLDLAKAFKGRANLVAPDKVKSQAETRKRIAAYGKLLAPCAAKGAWIIVVPQLGKKAPHLFFSELKKTLVKKGVPADQIVAGLPIKAGMKLEGKNSVQAFAEHFGDSVERYHLLGVSPINRQWSKFLASIWAHSPDATITADATTMVSGVRGDYELLGVVPRVYSYAQDIVRYELMFEAWQKSYHGYGTMENWIDGAGWEEEPVFDYTDNIYDPDYWLPKRYRKILSDEIKSWGWLSQEGYKLLLKSANAWLNTEEGDRFSPWVTVWLDEQWVQFLGSYLSARVKRDALVKAWNASLLEMRELMPLIDDVIDAAMKEAA